MRVKFQLSSSNSFRDMTRGPKFTLGAMRPSDAPLRKNFHPRKEYVTLTVCVRVKFRFSISDSFLDIRGSQIYTRGAAPLRNP